MKLTMIEAGEIVTTHGVRGEVKVLPWGDGPEFLRDFTRVKIGGCDYPIEKCRIQKDCNLLKLRGVDTMEAAEALRGQTVLVYRDDAPEGIIFAGELIGMQVYSDDTLVGELTDVLDYPGNKVYEIHGEHEYLIPAVKEFILSVDLEKNRMNVKLLEGMESDED